MKLFIKKENKQAGLETNKQTNKDENKLNIKKKKQKHKNKTNQIKNNTDKLPLKVLIPACNFQVPSVFRPAQVLSPAA